MYKNLTEYIRRLEAQNELIRVSEFVDTRYEMTEIVDRFSKQYDGGKAILFENNGTQFPVLMNMFGSDRRIAMSLGVDDLDTIAERIYDLFDSITSPKQSLTEKLMVLPTLGKVSRWFPKNRNGAGECQQIIIKENIDLDMIPILKCWPHDGGRFVTLPMVNTMDPHTGVRNVGMYRMQVLSKKSTGMHWHMHKTGARHFEQYRALGKPMPVTVCLGGDPAYTYAATAPLPDNIDEYLLAGFLRDKPVELVKCITNDLRVPADCDFVIEGYVDTAQAKVIEGPFGDHTGFYSLEDFYPEFHITCITHRIGAIYPATIVGVPPQEDAYIAKATERIFLAPIRLVMQPEIRDMYMPEQGVAHNIAVIAIEKSFIGQAFKVAGAMWGAGQMMFNKFMVITSEDADIRSTEQLAELFSAVDPTRDLMFARGPLDVLDHTAPTLGYGSKLCIDLTQRLSDEESVTEYDELSFPDEIELPWEFTKVDDSLLETWRTLIVCVGREIDNSEKLRELTSKFIEDNEIEGVKYVLIADNNMDINDKSALVWLAAGNVDPLRDIFITRGVAVVDARAKYNGFNGFNRRWPNVVTSDTQTIEAVDRRWDELFTLPVIDSPSRYYDRFVISEGASVE